MTSEYQSEQVPSDPSSGGLESISCYIYNLMVSTFDVPMEVAKSVASKQSPNRYPMSIGETQISDSSYSTTSTTPAADTEREAER